MQTKYPRNLKFPNFNKGAKLKFSEAKAKADAAQGSSSRSSSHSSQRYRSQSPGRRPHVRKLKADSRKSTKSKARMTATRNDTSEPEDTPQPSDSSESEELGKLVSSLAINYSHIDVTPPPSPPFEQ